MRRALSVVLIAVLIASVAGIDVPSWAREQTTQASDPHQREIASRAARIGVNRVVRIERMDGTRINAVLESILPDAIVVTILEQQNRRTETIPFADIDDIDEVRGHALRNVLIGIGIGVAVLVGTCAAALPSLRDNPSQTAP